MTLFAPFTLHCIPQALPWGWYIIDVHLIFGKCWQASLVAQLGKNPPAIQETLVRFLGWEDPLGEGHGNPLQYACLENPHGQRSLVGYSPEGHTELDMTKVTYHACTMHASNSGQSLVDPRLGSCGCTEQLHFQQRHFERETCWLLVSKTGDSELMCFHMCYLTFLFVVWKRETNINA